MLFTLVLAMATVIMGLKNGSMIGSANSVIGVRLTSCGIADANGAYIRQKPDIIPEKFSLVCRKARWDPEVMWDQLTDGECPWYLKDDGSGAYIYYNRGDNKWWIDGTDGLGLYTASVRAEELTAGPPTSGWTALNEGHLPLPTLILETGEDP